MGPTASGKTRLSVALAEEVGGECINADSMQVYEHLSIGTCVPTEEERRGIPHHLFQFLGPDAEPDAAQWARKAATTIAEVEARGKVPIVVGGTFFWMRALFEGFSPVPRIPRRVRRRLTEELERQGLARMYQRLQEADPILAARLHPADTQRILRGLEVFEATGTRLSFFQGRRRKPALLARKVFKLVLMPERGLLHARIRERVDDMLRMGLVQEVRRVLEMGYPREIRPFRSPSYAPVLDFLDGRLSSRELRDKIANRHRQYARRQITWLRKESADVEIDPDTTCLSRLSTALAPCLHQTEDAP